MVVVLTNAVYNNIAQIDELHLLILYYWWYLLTKCCMQHDWSYLLTKCCIQHHWSYSTNCCTTVLIIYVNKILYTTFKKKYLPHYYNKNDYIYYLFSSIASIKKMFYTAL